jgi:hypothetical protein
MIKSPIEVLVDRYNPHSTHHPSTLRTLTVVMESPIGSANQAEHSGLGLGRVHCIPQCAAPSAPSIALRMLLLISIFFSPLLSNPIFPPLLSAHCCSHGLPPSRHFTCRQNLQSAVYISFTISLNHYS